MECTPIGWVKSDRTAPVDDDWDSVTSVITLDPSVVSDRALLGLEQFSHLEVVYVFDRVDPSQVERGARHPRGNTSWPEVGILAQRAKNRPNRLGLCCCRLTQVDRAAMTLHVRDLDAIHGTPVLDINPWMAEFGPRGPTRQPGWSSELMAAYWTARGPYT